VWPGRLFLARQLQETQVAGADAQLVAGMGLESDMAFGAVEAWEPQWETEGTAWNQAHPLSITRGEARHQSLRSPELAIRGSSTVNIPMDPHR
jgi:hypothetical protein